MAEQHSSLGSTFDPLHIQAGLPYDFYARLRQEEPITFSPTINAYLVSRYDDIRSILSQPDVFSSKNSILSGATLHPETITELMKGYPYMLTTIGDDGARHTRMRRPFQNALSPTQVRAMEPFIRETATRLIDRFISNGQAEIISQFAYRLPLEVMLSILGIPQQDLEMVKRQTDAGRMMLGLPLPPEEQAECARQYVALQHYYARLIEEKRKNPADDLISDLIRDGMREDDPLSDTEIINQIAGVVLAGHETTTHLIGSGLFLLLEEPTRWQTLCEHPEQIPLALEELLRVRGPALGFMRTTTREVTVGGITMPEGTQLLLLYASGSRDESQFPHADTFDMQRQPNPHLGFGYGVHSCVGAGLARVEGRIAFENLTQRIPNMRLKPDQQFEYGFRYSNYGYQRIYIQWD